MSNNHGSKKTTVKKTMLIKRKMHEENEMKLDCECGLNYSLILKVIKKKSSEAVRTFHNWE